MLLIKNYMKFLMSQNAIKIIKTKVRQKEFYFSSHGEEERMDEGIRASDFNW